MQNLSEQALARVITSATQEAIKGLRGEIDSALLGLRQENGSYHASVDERVELLTAELNGIIRQQLETLRSEIESTLRNADTAERERDLLLRERMTSLSEMIRSQISEELSKVVIPPGETGPPGAAGPSGKDGHDGRDGKVTPAAEYEQGKDYVPQEMVFYRGGLWQAYRRTSKAPHEANSGWQCVVRGVESIGVSNDDEDVRGALVAVAYSDGSTAEFPLHMGKWLHLGVWDPTRTYAANDIVMLRGSSWLSRQDDNRDEPGSSAMWRMVAQSGSRGKMGLKGDTGERGIKGERGDPGAKGDKGDTGERGLQGERGEPGAKGDKGDKGEPGAKGDKGDKGDPGPRGAKGDAGENGLDGAPGEPGRDGAVLVHVDSVVHADHTDVTFRMSDGATYSVYIPQGPQGPRGEKGERGEPGRSNMEWRGLYRPENDYQRGDVVRTAGGLWIATVDTRESPVHSAANASGEWELIFSFDSFALEGGKRESH